MLPVIGFSSSRIDSPHGAWLISSTAASVHQPQAARRAKAGSFTGSCGTSGPTDLPSGSLLDCEQRNLMWLNLVTSGLFDQDHGAPQGSDQNYSAKKESIMEKRSTVHAVYAESLVFESNFGLAAVPATNSSKEVTERVKWIPAWSAAALACENIRTNDTTKSPIVH